MSELGRGFDPTIDEDEARRRPTAPGIDAPTPMTAPEADLPVAPANVPHDAVAREAPEPASRPPSTDTQPMQGLPSSGPAPAPAEPSVTAATAAKATGIVGGDPQADRADAEAEAIAAAKYDRAVLSAIATKRMMADTETSELIYDIAREFNADVETVRRNLKDYKTRYWEKQALKLSGAQKELMRENPALARDIFKGRDGFDQLERGLSSISALKHHESLGMQIVKGAGHFVMGLDRAHYGMIADEKTYDATSEIDAAQRDLADIEAFERGEYRPDGPIASSRLQYFLGSNPTRRQEIKEGLRALLAKTVEENPTYIEGRKLDALRKVGVEKEYQGAYDWGDATGRLVIGAGLSVTGIGLVPVIKSEAGRQTQDAIDATRGAHEHDRRQQYIEVKDRNTLLGLVMALPAGRAITAIPGVKQTIGRVETFVGPNGVRGMRILGEGVEGGVSGGIETALQNVIAQGVFDPQKDTSDGILQSVIVGFAVGGGGAAVKEGRAAMRGNDTQVLKPIEIDTLRARGAAKLAGNLEETLRLAQHGLRISHDPAALAKYIEKAAEDRTLLLPRERLGRLVASGKLTPDNIRHLGIEDQIADATGSGDIKISLRRLMTSKLAPEHIGDVAHSVKLDARADSGHDAAAFLKQRDRTLTDLAARMKNANPADDDGAFVFAHARRYLEQDGSLSDHEIQRQAAQLTERFLQEAREGKSKAAKYGPDFLYFREVSRSTQVRSDLPEDVRLEQEFQSFRTMRQGTDWPGAAIPAGKPPAGGQDADKQNATPPSGGTRRPASPRWSEHPTTIPTLPAVE